MNTKLDDLALKICSHREQCRERKIDEPSPITFFRKNKGNNDLNDHFYLFTIIK